MANKVLGFTINIKGQNEIKTTTQLLGLLNTQMILLSNTVGSFDTNTVKLSKDLKKSFDTFKDGNKIAKDLGNGYFEVTKQIEKKAKVIKESSKEELVALEINRKITRENKQIAKQEAIIQTEKKDNIASLRAQLSLTTLQWKKFTVEELANSEAGKKVAAEKTRLTALLLKEEKATGDARRQVGFYEKATSRLGKTLLRLSLGRDVLRGLFQGLQTIVEENKEFDASAKSVSESFEKLISGAKKFGLGIISFIAKPLEIFVNGAEAVSKALFGVGFGTDKASEGVRDLQREFNSEIEVLKKGNISTEARSQLIKDINTKYKEYLPNLINENSTLEDITRAQDSANKAFEKKITLLASEEQFVDLTKRRLDALREEASLQNQLSANEARYQEALRTGRDNAQTGINTSAEFAKQNVQNTNARIKANQRLIDEINREKAALDAVIRAEGINTADFVSNGEKKESSIKKTEAKLDEASEAEKKRNEELIKDRRALLQELNNFSNARIALVKQLGEELSAIEIQLIQDSTRKALAEERQRYGQEREQQQNAFNTALDDLTQQEAKIQALFGDGSAELIAFQKKSGQQFLQVQQSNNELLEAKARQHQENLNRIETEGEQSRIDAQQKAFDDEIAETEAKYDELERIEGERSDALIAKQIEAQNQEDEQRQERNQATKDAAINLVNAAFEAISTIQQIAFDAENARFDAAIESRQQSISKLNKDLENATGLQKKFLEIQLKNEEDNLKKETEAKEEARKKQGEAQKAIAITQAIIAAALGIANAFSLPPPASFIAASATAVATGAQIAVIASQKFAEGGLVGANAPANVGNGRISTGSNIARQSNGDNILATVKQGEVILNEQQQRLLGGYKTFASIGVPGFANGGITGPPISAPIVANNVTDVNTRFNQFIDASLAMTAATNRRIDRISVNLDLNNLEDVQGNDENLNVLTTFG